MEDYILDTIIYRLNAFVKDFGNIAHDLDYVEDQLGLEEGGLEEIKGFLDNSSNNVQMAVSKIEEWLSKEDAKKNETDEEDSGKISSTNSLVRLNRFKRDLRRLDAQGKNTLPLEKSLNKLYNTLRKDDQVNDLPNKLNEIEKSIDTLDGVEEEYHEMN